ncbi:MAG: ABC transporter ATP-binding protein/permease [Spirochaetaceae bacterium]|jgi:ATP-binding cassette subfamily B protein|nr:ABC transporter ATP-binding protein/permease [Spirochaetaceae bacterium]
MFNIKNLLGLSDEGYKNFTRAVRAVVVSNFCLFLPFVVIIQSIVTLLEPLGAAPGGGALSALGRAALDTRRLWMLLGLGFIAAVLYFFAYRSEYRKTYTTAYRESEKIRLEVAERIRRLPLSFFNNKDLSELTTNMMADCTAVEHAMSHVAPILFGGIITDVVISALLALYDWRMALALFAALPVALGLIFGSRKLQALLGERHVQAKLAVSGQVQEYLEGIKVVKAFGLSGEKSLALERSLRTMMKEALKFEGFTGIFIVLASMVLQIGMGLVVLTGLSLLSGGSLGVFPLLTFILVSAKIYSPLIVIFTLLPEFFYFLVSTKRMQQIRQEPVMEGDENIPIDRYHIELKNVGFAYHEGEDVIKNVSLFIPQGRVTALVGPSGSGKSTLSRLIARFWDVREGEILIGGKNIAGIDPETLMGKMSFVFQEVVLFNDTVRNNIRIGKAGASDEEVYAAARAARCDEFIRELPGGYDTVIGENGSTLSGGERQRISIARSLLKNAPIVLLDEATASLDPENETLIQEALSELVKDRTVLVIAHRLRTVRGADQIAVLENGRLAERGSAEELLAAEGLFARLHRIQQETLGWTTRPPVAL